MKKRCFWCNLKNPLYVAYHDHEWGVPCRDERKLYETFILETFQAGLSWECILNKRENFRAAYDNFDLAKICTYRDAKLAELMQNSGIIRNRAKLRASINNSLIYRAVCTEFGSFNAYLQKFTAGLVTREPDLSITTSPLSDAISADLKKRDMTFVGSTTIYAFLQAVGIINSHSSDCFLAKNLRSCEPVPKIEEDSYDWWARHELKCAAVREQLFRIVFIGDSLTHFWTRESPAQHAGDEWDRLYGKLPALNLGFGFDRTQNVLWRLEHGELAGQSPALFIVNIGTNQFTVTEKYSGDTPEEAASGVLAVLNQLRRCYPGAKIIDMAVFPRGGYGNPIRELNEILARQVPLIPDTVFLDISRELSLPSGEPDPGNYQPDLCHINRNGYRLWSCAISPYVEAVSAGSF